MIEVLVGTAFFVVATLTVFSIFFSGLNVVLLSRARTTATATANEKIEEIRNMQYEDIGTTSGMIGGDIPSEEQVTRGNIQFVIRTSVRWVDDPFDGNFNGTVEGKPVDLYPYDYKKVQVKVSWVSRISSDTEVLSATNVSPKGAETASNTGSIYVTVIDADGDPVPEAEITLENANLGVNFTETSDIEGKLLIPSLAPDTETYHLSTTKSGYSADQTDPITPENPSPSRPDLSVIVAEIAYVTFSIDSLSNLEIACTDNGGNPINGVVSIEITGSKLIGTPDVYKYNQTQTTDDTGHLSLSGLEWDSYTFEITTGGYSIDEIVCSPPQEIDPEFPGTINLDPGTNLSVTIKLK